MESVESKTWAMMAVKRTPESARLKKASCDVRHAHTRMRCREALQRSKTVHDNGEHVLCRKHRDILRVQYGGTLQFSKAFAGQFDQVPARWWWVLKIVVDSIDGPDVRLKRFCADGA